MKVEINPEPDPVERTAILAALAEEEAAEREPPLPLEDREEE